MSKLISLDNALMRLRRDGRAVSRTTVMNWITRGHLEDLRPNKGTRRTIILDEEKVRMYAESKGYTFLSSGSQPPKGDVELLIDDVERLRAAVVRLERLVNDDHERLAKLRSITPRRLADNATAERKPYLSPLERALATKPTTTAQRLGTPVASAEADDDTGSRPDTEPVSYELGEVPRWTTYNPSAEQIPYPQFWVGRGRVPRIYLASFVPCVRAHGVSQNTAGSMRASWLSRRERGLPQRFEVTYLEPDGLKDGQMLLTRENAIQVVERLQKEARDKIGKRDPATVCRDPMCPVCPRFYAGEQLLETGEIPIITPDMLARKGEVVPDSDEDVG